MGGCPGRTAPERFSAAVQDRLARFMERRGERARARESAARRLLRAPWRSPPQERRGASARYSGRYLYLGRFDQMADGWGHGSMDGEDGWIEARRTPGCGHAQEEVNHNERQA